MAELLWGAREFRVAFPVEKTLRTKTVGVGMGSGTDDAKKRVSDLLAQKTWAAVTNLFVFEWFQSDAKALPLLREAAHVLLDREVPAAKETDDWIYFLAHVVFLETAWGVHPPGDRLLFRRALQLMRKAPVSNSTEVLLERQICGILAVHYGEALEMIGPGDIEDILNRPDSYDERRGVDPLYVQYYTDILVALLLVCFVKMRASL